jgi:hypothetical protein
MSHVFSVLLVTQAGHPGWIIPGDPTGTYRIGSQVERVSFSTREEADAVAKEFADKIRYYDIIPFWTDVDLPTVDED